MPSSHPAHRRAGDRHSTGSHDCPGKPLLHMVMEPLVRPELGSLRASGPPIRVPLGGDGPVLQLATARRRIAAQLTRDRGRRTAELASDVTHTPLAAWRTAIASRSANDRKRADKGASLFERIPPASRNQRDPTAGATPAVTPASSLESPGVTASQNRCRCSRLATGGRPGDRIAGLPVRAVAHPGGRPIATPPHRGVASTD